VLESKSIYLESKKMKYKTDKMGGKQKGNSSRLRLSCNDSIPCDSYRPDKLDSLANLYQPVGQV
jgi:hypothetical protein